MESLIDRLSIGIVIADKQGQLLFTNQTIKEMTGYTEDDIKTMEDWYKKAYPDQEYRKKAKKYFQYDIENNIQDRTYKITTAAGDYKYFNFRYSQLDDEKIIFEIIDISHRLQQKHELENKEHNQLIYAVIDDITESKKQELELKEVKERLELAVSGGNIGIWDWNAVNNTVHFNENWARMLGYEHFELENNLNTWLNLVHPDDKEQALKDLENHLEGKTEKYYNEHRLKTKSGSWKWIRDIGKVTERDEAGNAIRIVGVHIDIDQEKRAAEEIEYLSNHDELTGLYNRRFLNEELKRLQNSRKYPISIIVGDINKLKDINDNYGHSMGDRYIKLTAEAIKSSLRAEDIVARIGGDEFVVILPDTNCNTAEEVTERILDRIEEVNKNEELPEPLSAALGYEATDCNSENHGVKNIRKCYDKADKKMYEQKFVNRCRC
ncbi:MULTISPECIES: diguanylate cyclase domain-containing protein [unclassified Halanaerobium]|uniref:sensor domain-containing diguanylate cyclase n=1 Tax=unclassified Halanaerobium TaxID=2641197 RepID=UPI000E19E94B|nr:MULTISPECIES: diguanylate cyclase [unclassified Halanaerobium]RCW50733.1 PAS domain S-box-containing protein/diguanylate cyclase (GGDEF)-like protein [Halanaerobium sp. MA284_MarDTE_T2]RCW78178.1 PAS domain S-box-containing protein/diguanylate cyclase (GGDEF)-like protein [Halanaerobium sp. DL-01]